MNKLTLDPNKKLYAVCWANEYVEGCTDEEFKKCEEMDIWTLSQDPLVCGWETDAGCSGYGLTKADAELIAARWNASLPKEESNNE
jgi:hypothetical protein